MENREVLRVLMVIYGFGYGGTEAVIMHYYRHEELLG